MNTGIVDFGSRNKGYAAVVLRHIPAGKSLRALYPFKLNINGYTREIPDIAMQDRRVLMCSDGIHRVLRSHHFVECEINIALERNIMEHVAKCRRIVDEESRRYVRTGFLRKNIASSCNSGYVRGMSL